MTNKKGFTLAEITTVVIIVAVIASLALPRYNIMLEKTRAAEAVLLLGHLREAQMGYKLRYGTYAGSNVGWDAITIYPDLDYESPLFDSFDRDMVGVFNCYYGQPYCVLAEIYRLDGNYHLHIQEDGQIDCTESAPPWGICDKLGYKNDYS